MGEIQRRLLIGGMVLRNLGASLDSEANAAEPGWTGGLWIDPPQFECLPPGRPDRLELADERASQVEVTQIGSVSGRRRLRAHLRGYSPQKWSAFAHEYHHDLAVTPLSVALFGEV